MSDDQRYHGKPLLRLLEFFVLRAIGELPIPEQEALDRLGPKLQAVYGGDGSWHAAIAAAVRMPPETAGAIRDMWTRNLEIARANGVEPLTPQKFAEMVVDESLS